MHAGLYPEAWKAPLRLDQVRAANVMAAAAAALAAAPAPALEVAGAAAAESDRLQISI